MDGKQFKFRVGSIVVVLLVILTTFLWVLFDLQYVNGASYLEQSRRKIAKTETVEAARGLVLDRYGRVLITNRASYNVGLDTSFMGERINDILLELLALCREEDVVWTDTLPISPSGPFVFTFDDSSVSSSSLQKLAKKRDWTALLPTEEEITALQETASSGDHVSRPSATSLFNRLREVYDVPADLSDTDARALVGVRYELDLRTREITYSDYAFAQDVEMPFIVKVKEADLPGVSIDTTTVRAYNTPYAAHLLGRVGPIFPEEVDTYREKGYALNAKVGKDGMEQAFEEYLHGTAGKRAIETNDQGKVVSGDENWVVDSQTGQALAPVPGGSVITTLDIKLQEVVERALATGIEGLKSTDTQGGAAVVIDVRDGGVLSSASYPVFDLTQYSSQYNDLLQNPLHPLVNRATQGTYPPGSTFKMVTAVAGLETGTITPQTKVLDTGRYTFWDSPQPQCWLYRQTGRTHGVETVSEAIRDSCNIFFFDTGRRVGIEQLDSYAKQFGLGEKTGIEIAEQTGRVGGPETSEQLDQKWYGGQVLNVAIGQDNSSFTPLQLANYVATLANGGTHYSAHLLKEVKSSDFSEVLYQHEPEVLGQVELSSANLEAVKKGMLMVTTETSAKTYFQNLDVQVAAKTGSAQVSSKTESNSLFVCFAPYDDPEIAVAIVVEKGGSGSLLAGIASEILEYYFSSSGGMETVPVENTLLR